MPSKRINQQDINEFMEVILPIQVQLNRKYGKNTVSKAQQARRDRIQAAKDAMFAEIDEAMNERG